MPNTRIENRLRRQSLRMYDNFVEDATSVSHVIEVEYMPCHKTFMYGVIGRHSLRNFVRNLKTWVKNILELDLNIQQFVLSGMSMGVSLEIERHFQTMDELREVYYFTITPVIGTDEIYPRYIPHKSFLDIDSSHRQLFKPPTGYNIFYFECVFKMGSHKKKYNILVSWTLQEFITKVLAWFIRDCRLDGSIEYEIVTLNEDSLPNQLNHMSIKNLYESHRALFPAFYIRPRTIVNIPTIQTIITPIITPIITQQITNIPTEECSVCLEMTPNTIANQHFRDCRHLLCSGCNTECIRTGHITCPQCRGPRRILMNN